MIITCEVKLTFTAPFLCLAAFYLIWVLDLYDPLKLSAYDQQRHAHPQASRFHKAQTFLSLCNFQVEKKFDGDGPISVKMDGIAVRLIALEPSREALMGCHNSTENDLSPLYTR